MYVQAVARHFVKNGHQIAVKSSWSEVFSQLPVKVLPFERHADINCHYTLRKHYRTDQFQDCCLQAGIKEPVDFKLDWAITDQALVDSVGEKAKGRKVILVQMARRPMDRIDGYGAELLPYQGAYQACVDGLSQHAFTVLVGAGHPVYEVKGTSLDLTNKASVSQLLDLAKSCDGLLGYCSLFVPLAEQFSKRALYVWARAGLRSRTPYIRQITPQKILHRKDLLKAVCDDEDVLGALNAVL